MQKIGEKFDLSSSPCKLHIFFVCIWRKNSCKILKLPNYKYKLKKHILVPLEFLHCLREGKIINHFLDLNESLFYFVKQFQWRELYFFKTLMHILFQAETVAYAAHCQQVEKII